MEKFTPKQERFIEEYVIDNNGTQAAIRAGYAETGARVEGSRLLSNANIQDAVAAQRKKISENCEITAERVLKEYGKLAFLDIKKVFDERGNLLPIHSIPDDAAAAIAGIEVEDLYEGRGESREHIGKLHKIKLSDKKGALDSIARHLGMFNDTLDVNMKGKVVNATVEFDTPEAAMKAFKEIL